MPVSPRINFRITEEMGRKLEKEAKRRKKTLSAAARDILSEALGMSDNATQITQGRPPISKKS